MSRLVKLLAHLQGFCQLMRKRGVPLTWLPRGRLVAAALVGNYLADDVLGEVWLWDTATRALLYRQPLDMPFT